MDCEGNLPSSESLSMSFVEALLHFHSQRGELSPFLNFLRESTDRGKSKKQVIKEWMKREKEKEEEDGEDGEVGEDENEAMPRKRNKKEHEVKEEMEEVVYMW